MFTRDSFNRKWSPNIRMKQGKRDITFAKTDWKRYTMTLG